MINIQQSGFARTQNKIKTKLKCLYHSRRLPCAHAQTGLYSSGNMLAAK